MAAQIQGLSRLLKNLDDISHYHAENAINYVAKELDEAIKREGREFSKIGINYINSSDIKKYEYLTVKEVGFFKADGKTWKDWKGVYFQHYGYFAHNRYGTNYSKYIDKHKGWFDDSIIKVKPILEKELKRRIENEIVRTFEK